MVQDLCMISKDSDAPPIPPRHPARSPGTGESNQQEDPTFDLPDLSNFQLRNQNLKLPLPAISHNPRLSGYSGASPTDSPSTLLPTRESVSEPSLRNSSVRYSNSSYASSDAGQSSAGWQSPQSVVKQSRLSRQQSILTKKTPASPEIREQNQRPNSRHSTILPSPAIGSEGSYELARTLSQAEIERLYRSSTTASQRQTFEKEAFRNSAILCDV
jgi:hypothetical protein